MWQIDYSKQSYKFIQKQKNLEETVKLVIKRCILKLQGGEIILESEKERLELFLR